MGGATQIDSTVITASPAEQGTTDRLFPELVKATNPDGKVAAEPIKEVKAVDTAIPPQPKYLDVQEFGDAIFKTKVDGVEFDIPVKDVVRAYQTDRYLTQKGQRLAEEARRIEEQKASSKTSSTPEPKIEEDGLYTELIKPHTEQLSKQILTLSEQVKQMQENERMVAVELAPARYEKVMTNIDSQLKKEGLDDFKQKLPEIEKIMLAMPPDKMAEYDNPPGFEYLYRKIKLNELVQKERTSTTTAKPKIIPIESSSSPSNVNTEGNDRNKEFMKAKKTGDWADFMMKYG
ncbi:MAG: hypothetical protein Q8O68_00935 [Candidatus Daviesbacteria bacterium]|nr:hypothetical protein [Candidatus Daviesbacteria bacterium]